VVSTKPQPSPEPAGTVLETDPPIGAVVERGTEVTIIISNGPPSQQSGNDGSVENAAPEAEVSPTPTQPSKKKDSNDPAGQKSSNAAPASEMSSTPIKRDKKSSSR
jgi:beta-lactam-binding protein with PASTA domain